MARPRIHSAALGLAIALGSLPVAAVDLGTIGPVYPIAEPHLIEEIQAILRKREASGELARLQRESQERAVKWIENPPPVEGVRTATTPRVFHLDPSIVVEQNIIDDKGRVIVPVGTRVNPLEHISLSRPLLFIDARDPRQQVRAQQLLNSGPGARLVLTAGSYTDLMRRWKVRVYYDQGGEITRRFGITQVPALVTQEGTRLRIEEFTLQELP
jgi:conjugal transfer pilus assembly protein TraW